MQRSNGHATGLHVSGDASQKMPEWPAPSPPSLSDVARALGPSIAHLVGDDEGPRRPVSTLVLYDPLADLRRVTAGFLLAVGVLPKGEHWQALLNRASDRGYVCVGVKAPGVSRQELADSVADRPLAVVALADEISWERFFTLASSAMHQDYSAEQTLGNTRLGDLFALANAVASAVGGATAIVDPRQCIIAYSAIEGQPIDETRRKSILGLRVPPSPDTELEYRAVHRAFGVLEIPSSNADYPRLAVPIRAGGELLGSMWVIDRNGSVGSAPNKTILNHAAEIAALHLLQARTESELVDRRRGEMLSAMLDNPEMAAEAAGSLGIPRDRAIRIVALSIAERPLSGETVTAYHQTLELVRLHCRAELGFSVATVRPDMLYLVLPVGAGDHQRQSQVRLLRGIDAHARRSYGYRLVIGLGAAVSGLDDVGKSMVQAGRVVRLMRRDLETEGRPEDEPLIGFSEDLTTRLALSALAKHVAELEEAAGHTIGTMLAYDSANATDYVPTLRAFFRAHGNIRAMAQILHVHANTCRYRLSRIAEVFDIDLEDQDTRLVLWLQMRLQELNI